MAVIARGEPHLAVYQLVAFYVAVLVGCRALG